MSDMDLGRPPRHARPETKRHEPRQIPTATVIGTDEPRACGQCGAAVVLRIDGDLPEFLREIALRRLNAPGPVLCEECTDTLDAQTRAQADAERRAETFERRRRRSGIPAKWAAQTFTALDADEPRLRAMMRAREWAAGETCGLVLWGPVGRGKTALAAAAANARMAVSGVRWLSVSELLMDLSAPFGSEAHTQALARLRSAGSDAALVLDDLDKLKPTEHAVQPIYVAVNGWIEAGLPLLVTLNRDLDELERWLPDTFGEAISSRLAGYCKVQNVGGVDRRLKRDGGE